MIEFKVTKKGRSAEQRAAAAALQAEIRQARAKLDEARKSMTDLTTPNRRAAVFLDRWVQLNFKTEGGQVGGWEPFTYGGRLTHDGVDTSAKLLQDTGRGRLSFLPFADKKQAGIGTEIDYMEQHDRGIGVTQRRILPEAAEVRQDLFEIYGTHVKTNVVEKRYTK